jgi:hypothetical protein
LEGNNFEEILYATVSGCKQCVTGQIVEHPYFTPSITVSALMGHESSANWSILVPIHLAF